MRPNIERNIAANVATRAWGFASAYLFVPLYLKFLGIEAYGLVGFYSTLLAMVAFADMGLTPTLTRELARMSVREGAAAEMRDLLRTYESLYLAISIALASAFWVLSPWLGARWLRTVALQPAETTEAIRLLGLSIALQLPTALYLGGLMGLEKQGRAAYLQVAIGALRGVGGVLVLLCLSPTIVAFAWWQLVVNAIGVFAVRTALWRALSTRPAFPPARFSWKSIGDSWRYAAGMASMAILSALLTQADRLVLSKMLSLEKFSYYSLAGSLASIPILISGAIASAVFPRLTAFVAAADGGGTVRLYHRFTSAMAVVTFPLSLTLVAFSDVALYAWTGSRAVAQNGAAVAQLLLIGQLMQVVMSGPFYLELAHGGTRLTVYFGLCSLAIIVPLLIGLIPIYGMIGAGMTWVAMNVCTLPAYVYLVHRRRLPGEIRPWLLGAVAIPLVAAAPAVLLGRWLVTHTDSRLVGIGQLGAVCFASLATCLIAVPGLRNDIVRRSRELMVRG
jgi:O-antigen/teichoic acid export membrane protein